MNMVPSFAQVEYSAIVREGRAKAAEFLTMARSARMRAMCAESSYKRRIWLSAAEHALKQAKRHRKFYACRLP